VFLCCYTKFHCWNILGFRGFVFLHSVFVLLNPLFSWVSVLTVSVSVATSSNYVFVRCYTPYFALLNPQYSCVCVATLRCSVVRSSFFASLCCYTRVLCYSLRSFRVFVLLQSVFV